MIMELIMRIESLNPTDKKALFGLINQWQDIKNPEEKLTTYMSQIADERQAIININKSISKYEKRIIELKPYILSEAGTGIATDQELRARYGTDRGYSGLGKNAAYEAAYAYAQAKAKLDEYSSLKALLQEKLLSGKQRREKEIEILEGKIDDLKAAKYELLPIGKHSGHNEIINNTFEELISLDIDIEKIYKKKKKGAGDNE